MRTFINAGPAAVDYDDSADEQEASGGGGRRQEDRESETGGEGRGTGKMTLESATGRVCESAKSMRLQEY